MKTIRPFLTGLAALAVIPLTVAADTVWLHELDLAKMKQGWGKPQVNRSIREKPLTIAGQTFAQGVGTHANGSLWLELGGATERFTAKVGLDDAANGPGSVQFRIVGDGKKLFESTVLKPGSAAVPVDLDLRGVKQLLLQVRDGGDRTDFDHADWAEAQFTFASGHPPVPTNRPGLNEAPYILTPPPGPAPRINGPTVYGCRPGHPFLYRIPTQGKRPMDFTAGGLPGSLQLDPVSGIISGTAPTRGTYHVTLRASNAHGKSRKSFTIVSGDTLALTPPMGWNHWYAHYDRVTDAMMRHAADTLVDSGMAEVGYAYVDIDDCWMNAPKHGDPQRVGPLRDERGRIIPNKYFPDMPALTGYIHSFGLKAGIYTSPGTLTCGGFAGAWQHEADDARQFAEWGFDLLKYDWCSYGEIANKDPDPELVKFKKPYQYMGALLRQQPRDIQLNLCQYGMGEVWKWGAEVGGHSWRTAGDLGFELDRVFEVALANAKHRDWQKPGAWNDPDYIQIGYIGDARGGGMPAPCPLSPTEQYSFMSLWCLSAAPLFYSGDMTKLDAFLLNVLCNPEVIDVDQDPLGQCGLVIPQGEETFLMVKDMADGSKAIGLCNSGELASTVTASWSALGVKGTPRVRDLWRQKDLGQLTDSFSAEVPRRGVVLIRVWPKK